MIQISETIKTQSTTQLIVAYWHHLTSDNLVNIGSGWLGCLRAPTLYLSQYWLFIGMGGGYDIHMGAIFQRVSNIQPHHPLASDVKYW